MLNRRQIMRLTPRRATFDEESVKIVLVILTSMEKFWVIAPHFFMLSILLGSSTCSAQSTLDHAQKMHKKCSKAANQTIAKAKSILEPVAQSLVNLKRALKLKPITLKTNGVATLVKQVEETPQLFGLGRDSPSTG